MLLFRVTDSAGQAYTVQTDGGPTADRDARSAIESQVGVTVVDVAPICAWYAMCDNTATAMMHHPIAEHGLPICDRCRDKCSRQSDGRSEADILQTF